MTEFLSTVGLSGGGSLLAQPAVENTLNVVLPRPALPTLAIAYAPLGAAFSYVAGSTTYATSFHYTAVNTLITFTATVTLPAVAGISVVEYYWDFGDGVTGYGNPVTHTYKIANQQSQVILRVTDSLGRRTYGRIPLYLT